MPACLCSVALQQRGSAARRLFSTLVPFPVVATAASMAARIRITRLHKARAAFTRGSILVLAIAVRP